MRGIRVAQRLRHHEHIHRILWITQQAGTLFLITEHPEDTLQTLLHREGRLKPDIAGHYMAQMLSGLSVLHASSIVHRNISLRTVLLCNNSIKLSGFEYINQVCMCVNHSRSVYICERMCVYVDMFVYVNCTAVKKRAYPSIRANIEN